MVGVTTCAQSMKLQLWSLSLHTMQFILNLLQTVFRQRLLAMYLLASYAFEQCSKCDPLCSILCRFIITVRMDHIPYSFAPLILFRVPYTLDFFRTIYRLQMALGV